ncbi:hypothetical protein PVK06_035087 [Gossypium arboreum]|uniref:Uncharacterized protein n=1 Tax=Gossypium arboreum TaxID=29729 RepID=A0ABR0NH24_GOSAR|nr:hypothetical protein PVK06_035087 [Gossypium arboreum]
MFVDINITGQKRSGLINTGASDLFISKKAAEKLSLLIKKSNRKIETLIQLVEDVSYGRNINSIERNATKAHSKKLVEHEIDMKPVKSTVELPFLGKVGCVSDFEGKVAMQKQSKRVNAASKLEQRLLANEMYQRVQRFKLRGDERQHRGSEGRDNLITRQVGKRPSFFWHNRFFYTNWCLKGILKESLLLGVKVDLDKFGRNGSPKTARIARRKI